MLEVTKDGRVRSINEQDLENHKQMGWSLVNGEHTTKTTKSKTIKSVELNVQDAEVIPATDDDLTPTEEN